MIPQITDAQRQQFERDGYFVLENVFTPAEMDELAVNIEKFQQRHEEALRAAGGTADISRAGEITFTDHLAEKDDLIRAFCKRPEFVAISTQMLGPTSTCTGIKAFSNNPKEQKTSRGTRTMVTRPSSRRLISRCGWRSTMPHRKTVAFPCCPVHTNAALCHTNPAPLD
jgi:ectoine hydroxylase-related dioxygenase (phytanoyl-CoA dioxygenase family)